MIGPFIPENKKGPSVFGPFKNPTYIVETGSEESGPVVSKGSKLDALRSSTSARPARAFRRDGARN